MNLERLAELINAHDWTDEWTAEIGIDQLRIITPNGWSIAFTPGCGDDRNATGLVWMLDRLEELGFNCALYRDSVYLERDGVGEGVDGETRAEACALALMQALEGE